MTLIDKRKPDSITSQQIDFVRMIVARPFRTERVAFALPAGGSVSYFMKEAGLDSRTSARIFLDDRLIASFERERIYPKPGQILTIRVVPAGAGRGKDNELLQLAFVAVAAAATWYIGGLGSVGAIGALGTDASSAATSALSQLGLSASTIQQLGTLGGDIFTAVRGASISFLTGFVANSLIPPPRTPAPKQETTPHSYTVSGTANAAAPFSPIPKLYGQRRIFPQYAASPYSELVGFNQYLRMLFLLGYGPLDISQIKIGDTAIEDYEDVEWELRAGFPDDAPTRLYPGSVSEADFIRQPSRPWRRFFSPKVATLYQRLKPSSQKTCDGSLCRLLLTGMLLNQPLSARWIILSPLLFTNLRKGTRSCALDTFPERRIAICGVFIANTLRSEHLFIYLFLIDSFTRH